MLKKLLIPAFAFTVAVVGCSSSSTTNPPADAGAGHTGSAGATAGTTGTAGSTAGTTGTAGATAGTTGTAGSGGATAGTTGTAGSDGGAGTTGTAGSDGGAGTTGTAGHDGGAAGTTGTAGSDGGVAGSDGGTTVPACTSTTPTSETMSAETFCKIFLADCGNAHVGYTTMTECNTTYSALGTAKPAEQKCTSYHLCNAASMTGDARMMHCGHAATPGTAPCNSGN